MASNCWHSVSIKEFNPSFFHKLHDFLLGGVIHQLPDRFNPSDTSSVAASSAAGDTAGATEKKSKEGSKMKRPAAAHEYHEPLGGGNDGNDDGDDGDENSGDRMSSQNDIPKDLRPPASKRPAAKTTPTPQKKPSRRKNAEDLRDGQFAAVFSITFKLKHIKLIAFRLTFRRVMSLESMVMLMAMLLLKLESLLSKTLHVRSSTCSFLESNECFAGMAIP